MHIKNDKMQLRATTYHIPGNHIGLLQLFVRSMNEKHTKFKVLNSKVISDNTVFACDDSQILKDILTFNDKIDGIEMEAAELYTLAAKFNRQALSILTVSDNIATGEATSSEERQSTFTTMMKIALETAIK